MGISEIIEKYYIKYKYPNLERLYNYLKEDEISITKKQVKEFLEAQTSKQITQQKKVFKSDGGHIVAYAKNELWQIDIFCLPKYYKSNHNYKFIFCAIDVFTRFVYCIGTKNILAALSRILESNIPLKIVSDSDSVFTSNNFKVIMAEHDIIHETVAVGDHPSLGIVDRFARTLKQRITDLFVGSDDTNWIDNLDEIIDDYNNSKNRGILNIKPKHANKSDNISLLVHLNHLKSLKNNTVSDLNKGDKVRIYIKTLLQKGTEPTYSNEVYTVANIRGKTITLDNGENKRRDTLLLVPPDTVGSNKKNLIQKATQDYKQLKELNKLK